MRLAIPLVQLALWTSCAVAFYPFTPAWLEEKEQAQARRAVDEQHAQGVSFEIEQRAGHASALPSARAAQEAARLSSKYGPRTAATNGALTRRDNKFHIMESANSGKAMTSGIDQDGTDYAYFVKVQLGSKGKQMYMLVDTGAASSWVMGSECTHNACLMHDTFGPADSNTLHSLPENFSISYGSGTVSGELATDTITLAGISFDYKFGLASDTSDDFTKFAFDGILGLSMGQGANENFLNKIFETRKLDKNIFCIALNRASDGVNTGEIKFGSTDAEKYTGNITYIPVGLEDGDWAIRIDDMAYDGNKAQAGGILSYIDTGTSFIFGPEDMVKKVHDVIPGANSSDGKTYTVPCDTNKPLTLTFTGVDYEISPKDWISPKDSAGKCTSNIYGFEVAKGSWLLGDTFLMNVYTVFDKDQKRVGFAKLASSKPELSSSVSSGNTKAPSQATDPPGSSSATSLPPSVSSHPDTPRQQSKATTGLVGPETPSSDVDKPKETSKSAATGVNPQKKAKLATAMLIGALLPLVA